MKRSPLGFSPLVLAAAFALASPVRAESGLVGLHAEAGPVFPLAGWQREELGVGVFGRGAFELSLAPWVGIEASALYLAFLRGGQPSGYGQIDGASATYAGLGVRFRPLNDDAGYLLPWGRKTGHVGNLWGNLWVTADAGYVRTGILNRFGCSLGIGYEFSLVNALQLGPFARAFYIPQPNGYGGRDEDDAWMILVGLSFTVAIPPGIRTEEVKAPPAKEDSPPPAEENEIPESASDAGAAEERDGDGDGIPDETDECPDDAETVNGLDDQDGCPDAIIEEKKKEILGDGRIFFDFGMVRLKTKSREKLEKVAALVLAHPEFEIILIQGHTDAAGPAAVNDELSAKRAERVKAFLVRRGIAQSRFRVEGAGSSEPLKKGYGELARAKNRRVELYIEEQTDPSAAPAKGPEPAKVPEKPPAPAVEPAPEPAKAPAPAPAPAKDVPYDPDAAYDLEDPS